MLSLNYIISIKGDNMLGREFRVGIKKVIVIRKGTPKKGEYFISGAIPTAYKTNHDLDRHCWVAVEKDDAKNNLMELHNDTITLMELELSKTIEALAKRNPLIRKQLTLTALENITEKIRNF